MKASDMDDLAPMRALQTPSPGSEQRSGPLEIQIQTCFQGTYILLAQSRQGTSKEVNMRISTGYKYSEETKCKEIRESPWGWECGG